MAYCVKNVTKISPVIVCSPVRPDIKKITSPRVNYAEGEATLREVEILRNILKSSPKCYYIFYRYHDANTQTHYITDDKKRYQGEFILTDRDILENCNQKMGKRREEGHLVFERYDMKYMDIEIAKNDVQDNIKSIYSVFA